MLIQSGWKYISWGALRRKPPLRKWRWHLHPLVYLFIWSQIMGLSLWVRGLQAFVLWMGSNTSLQPHTTHPQMAWLNVVFRCSNEQWKNAGGVLQSRVSRFLARYRVTPQAMTGSSPAVLIGRKVRCVLDNIKPDLVDQVLDRQGAQKFHHDIHHSRWCSIQPKQGKKLLIGSYYRPPQWHRWGTQSLKWFPREGLYPKKCAKCHHWRIFQCFRYFPVRRSVRMQWHLPLSYQEKTYRHSNTLWPKSAPEWGHWARLWIMPRPGLHK